MKRLLILGSALAMSGCNGSIFTGDIYNLPIADVYAKLDAVKIERSREGPFGRMDVKVDGNGKDAIKLTIDDQPLCTVSLTAVEAAKTKIAASCGLDGANVARNSPTAGLMATTTRNNLIEVIDAALHDRPFDPQRGTDGSTAAAWPADVVDHGTSADAAANALKAQADMADAERNAASGQ